MGASLLPGGPSRQQRIRCAWDWPSARAQAMHCFSSVFVAPAQRREEQSAFLRFMARRETAVFHGFDPWRSVYAQGAIPCDVQKSTGRSGLFKIGQISHQPHRTDCYANNISV